MRAALFPLAGLCLLPALAGTASAQNEERYRLERTTDGYVRMDTETGAMTLCKEQEGELVCRPASNEAEAAESEIETLRRKVTALEARVEALEGGGIRNLVPEEEFEQSLNMMERFFRRFVDIVKGLEQEETPNEPAPQQESAPDQRT
ncbi:hypothetical protein [Chelativorans sp. AA-79]|uniref:hypothetical protein n=1 Tax=Chelativorans sp. AA-79 TaxID=3028735 RepID=UPI0023F8483E|nr:hypothetical protein [Chelativorans sp. AA-79]WEX08952.1 hypothetical protein PVE73_23325 [Chelativorans sp. AA-79]